MLRQRLLLSVLALSSLVSACERDVSIEFETRIPSLQVNATITAIEFRLDDGKAIYRADAKISNTTDTTQKYSNKWLWLESGSSLKSRAYLDSVASNEVDISSIDLGANESLNLDVYWVFPSSELEEPSDDSFILALRPDP